MKTKTFFLLLVAILGTSACTQKAVSNKDKTLVDSFVTIITKTWNSEDIN